MNKYELTEDYANYYLNAIGGDRMNTSREDIIDWLRDYKNISAMPEDEIVMHIFEYAPGSYIELKSKEDQF